MFMYKDKSGNKVIFVRERCHCYTKRDHIFTIRCRNFCCCIHNVSWHTGLCSIALMTMFFGIIEFTAFNIIAFRGAPSAIHSYLMFPFFASLVFVELILFFTLGVMLWMGLVNGNLKVIKSFPWFLLFGYLLAILYVVIIIKDGEFIVHSLVLSDKGMLIKSQPKEENKALFIQRIIFYTLTTILILALLMFTTYIIILSLSWIDKLEIEIEDETF